MSSQSTEPSDGSLFARQLPHASSSESLTTACAAAGAEPAAASFAATGSKPAAASAATAVAPAVAAGVFFVATTGAQLDHHASSSDRIGDVGRGRGGLRLQPSASRAPAANIACSSWNCAAEAAAWGPAALRYRVVALPTTFTQFPLYSFVTMGLLAGGDTHRMRSLSGLCRFTAGAATRHGGTAAVRAAVRAAVAAALPRCGCDAAAAPPARLAHRIPSAP